MLIKVQEVNEFKSFDKAFLVLSKGSRRTICVGSVRGESVFSVRGELVEPLKN
jgi:hypothetical protein